MYDSVKYKGFGLGFILRMKVSGHFYLEREMAVRE